jgi:hypothetical protein
MSAGQGVELPSDGSLPATVVKVPSTSGLGSVTVSVTDNAGLVGTANFIVTKPVISLAPDTGSMGETTTVSGTGWVPNKSITVTGNVGGVTHVTAVVTSDGTGAFSTDVVIPNTLGVGKVELFFTAADAASIGNTSLAVKYTTAGAKITLSQSTAVVGDTVTVAGTGFTPNTAVTALTLAGANVMPIGAPVISDAQGGFTVEFTTPGLIGSKNVSATVGADTKTAPLIITAAPVTQPPAASTNTDVIFADEIASGNLVRVWRFTNSTQAWAFFDPRPAFANANTLIVVVSGDIVWINVTEQTTFQGQTLFPGWNLISLS